MKITLIITTYNWPESLYLVMKSVRIQSILPYEVIIADDGSTQETKDLVNSFINHHKIKIIYSWQEDQGFRASRSRNQAILKSSGDYIVLIDGDTILHQNFIKDHIKQSELGYFVQGSRVLLSKKQTQKTLNSKKVTFQFFASALKNRKNAIHSNFLSFIFSKVFSPGQSSPCFS